jgi:hypothetical protein
MTAEITSPGEIAKAHGLDGFADVFWNLGQVLAWVWTRSPFPVDAYSNSSKEMASRDHSAHPDLPFDAPKIAHRGSDENGLPRKIHPYADFDGARRAMLLSLQSGELIASGQPNTSLMRETIDSLMWADMAIDPSFSGEMIVRHRDDVIAWWKNVRVRRDDVLKCFPADVRVSTFEQDPAFVPLDDRTSSNLSPDEQSLSVRPPEGAFDPDKLSHWSLTMTIAWIIWGDIDAVREEWDDYRGQCVEWRFFSDLPIDGKVIRNATLDELAANDPEVGILGKTKGNWRFAAWAPSGWLGLEFKARRDEIPWEVMIETLWLAAGEGKIRATALECATQAVEGKMVEIPAHLWPRLSRKRETSGKAILAGPDRDYLDVRFARLDVKSLWPLKEVPSPAPDDDPAAGRLITTKRRTNNARGRPKEYKWDTEIKDFALSLVSKYGVPGEGNLKLPRQEDLVLAIQNEWAQKRDIHLADSTVRRYVSQWLAEL